jgi:hypothetical protein
MIPTPVVTLIRNVGRADHASPTIPSKVSKSSQMLFRADPSNSALGRTIL